MIGKYVVTPNHEIIVFSQNIQHNTFANLKPISAGFIKFMLTDGKVTCECFGESTSLNIKSNPIKDTRLAKIYLLCGNCNKEASCQGHCKGE